MGSRRGGGDVGEADPGMPFVVCDDGMPMFEHEDDPPDHLMAEQSGVCRAELTPKRVRALTLQLSVDNMAAWMAL